MPVYYVRHESQTYDCSSLSRGGGDLSSRVSAYRLSMLQLVLASHRCKLMLNVFSSVQI